MKHHYPEHTTLTTLPVKGIYALPSASATTPPAHMTRKTPKYPEPLILTLLLLGTREHASYRRLLFALAPNSCPTIRCPP